MAETVQIICDNPACRALKKAENHWWMLWIDLEGELHLRPLRGKPGEGVLTFCGEPCAMKKLSEFMSRANGHGTDHLSQSWSAVGPPPVIDLMPESHRRA